MCGIAGIIKPINPENDSTDLKLVAGALLHRGPDEEGFLSNPEALLAHRRLSIIDLGGGRQPMYNEDRSVAVIFNGEIYNYRELRHQLEQQKHQFATRSDTEVLVHLYEEFGASMTKFLNGMFAFVICDFKNQRALLIRDRAGQKPLFYAQQNGSLYFASELGAMKKFKSLQRDIDPEAINLFFSLQYIPAPRTIYHNVKKLLPGELLEYNFRNNTMKLQRYWQLDFSQKSNLSFDDAAAEFREILIDSVRRRMVADVPLGVFLSGGVDSTIIAGIMAKLSPGSIKSFSIGFTDSDYDERRYSALAAQAINSKNNDALDYREHIVDCGDFKLINTLLGNLGEPYADASIMPTAMLSDFARSNVTVALSGD
ncbi:MAG: asparagine synthase (glutamine-hydrolyzing), partial [Victivallaceae bacterium]